jgi:superfamily II DNA or RNA helicase
MTKRDQIQEDALNVALTHKRSGLAISMGVGKTLIGLNYINNLQGKNMGRLRVLVVAPKLSIFESWKNDADKFMINIESVDFTTYLSLNKLNHNFYDVVILDECHSLLDSHLGFLGNYSGRIMGLTGTPPRYEDSEKGRMVNRFCPIQFRYITDDAVADDILNDYRIIVHRMSLSNSNNLLVKLKDKEFYTSETKNYNYWSQRVYDANSPKQRQITSIMRMRSLMDFKTKENYAKNLLNEIDEKCILFCNTQDQADRTCSYSVHSKNIEADENLQMFKEGTIEKLSCVLQLNEGVNIPELRAGIIMHAYGNERKSNQRIGRLLRLNPDETATIHILCYKNTVDETWVTEALKDLDGKKIKYFDVDESL